MSFSSEVKEELINSIPHDRHCRLSELTAILAFAGKKTGNVISVSTNDQNQAALRKCFTLLNKTFNINTVDFEQSFANGHKSIDFDRNDASMVSVMDAIAKEAPNYLLTNDCCKRAYLRGAFLSAGFINDPEKAYHLEFVCQDEFSAEMLKEILEDFNIGAKSTTRRKYNVVYVKDADTIQDVLNVLEAHRALMDFVNVRITKDVRNDINRRNNFDVSNLLRASQTGSKQIEEIILIRDTEGLSALPEGIREIAELRLENPESSLAELGQMLDPPVGKSGVNHRLRKISEYAQKIGEKREKENDKEGHNGSN
ncbi:MAG: DNA-binding protein WhiA [Lachnospiraceae bacterium]|nr:DNA-binding protein WhiA [Lachnospiraceae bacterium]